MKKPKRRRPMKTKAHANRAEADKLTARQRIVYNNLIASGTPHARAMKRAREHT